MRLCINKLLDLIEDLETKGVFAIQRQRFIATFPIKVQLIVTAIEALAFDRHIIGANHVEVLSDIEENVTRSP